MCLPPRKVRLLILLLCVIHFSLCLYAVGRWLSGIVWTCRTYAGLAPDDRMYSCGFQEYQFIRYVRRHLPEDAAILWVPRPSLVSNYHLYPRRIYQKEYHQPGTDIVIDPAFLSSRGIRYVLASGSRFVEVVGKEFVPIDYQGRHRSVPQP